MPDPLRHVDLQAARSALRVIIGDVVRTTGGHPLHVAVAALACAFLSSCAAFDVDPADVLEQVEDADATNDLPVGALTAFS